MKRITALFCIFALVIFTSTYAFAKSTTDWTQFMGSPTSCGLTTAKTPINAASAQQIWSVNHSIKNEYDGMEFESNACGTPITVGNFLYLTTADGKLLKLNTATGKSSSSAECKNIPKYFSQIAYGDGKIYVPQQTDDGVQISAFDSENLKQVWQSQKIKYGKSAQQISSPITYYNKFIYFGTYTQNSNTYAYNSGVYVCIDTSTGKIFWQHTNDSAGYYWNGCTVMGSAVAVSDTNGNITSYNLTNGSKISTVPTGGPVNSTLCYAQGRIYASVKSGYIYSAEADKSGTIYGSTAIKSSALGNSISSSPVVYNNRLYVAGGGYGATTPFSVLNASNLKLIYQIKDIQSQSSPLISTAYADDTNNQQVLIYVTKYGTSNQDSGFSKDSSCLYIIKDSQEQTKPSYETLFTPSKPQSCTQSLTPSKDGRLFYFNDSGNLYAIDKKAVLSSPATETNSFSSVVLILTVSAGCLLFFTNIYKKSKQAE